MDQTQCRSCNSFIEVETFKAGYDYHCPTCGDTIHRSGASVGTLAILTLSTLVLFIWAISSPFLEVKIFSATSNSVLNCIGNLYDHGYLLSSFILFISLILIPATMMVGILLILIFEKIFRSRVVSRMLIYWYLKIKMWNSLEVYLFSILIAMIKMDELTDMSVMWGLLFLMVYILFFHITVTYFNPYDLIEEPEYKQCKLNSMKKTLIYLSLAVIFFIPANLLPMMPIYKFSVPYMNTITDGIMDFYRNEDYFVGTVILFSSFFIPVIKILGIFLMIIMVRFDVLKGLRRIMTGYYRWTYNLGKYSMVDIYVLVLLVSFIQYDQFVRIEMGAAAIPFTLVVIFTMLASKSFDVRLIWEDR